MERDQGRIYFYYLELRPQSLDPNLVNSPRNSLEDTEVLEPKQAKKQTKNPKQKYHFL